MRGWIALGLALCLTVGAQADDRDEHDYAVDDRGQLYRLRCDKAEVEAVGLIQVDGVTPTLWDIAATPDGFVYGISSDDLYLINVTEPGKSRRIGRHGVRGCYGLTAVGTVLLANTKDNRVLLIDRRTAQVTPLGVMGGDYSASGDIALVGDRLFSSVKDAAGRETLVELDPQTGAATAVAPLVDGARRGITNMYGLIYRKNVLYGLTHDGDLVRIDEATGQCQVLKRTGVTFYGATDCVRF